MHQSAPSPGQAPPRRPSRPKTAGNLAQELESGSAWILPPPPPDVLRSARCSPAKGGQRTPPGRWPCPRGGANRCPAHPAAVAHTWKSPPGQVCAPPGAGPKRGVGGARTGRRGERRRAGAGLARGVGGAGLHCSALGAASRIFLPTLVLFPPSCADWSARHVGRRVRGKICTFFLLPEATVAVQSPV